MKSQMKPQITQMQALPEARTANLLILLSQSSRVYNPLCPRL